MEQNNSPWLRRMREKHRRIMGINKLFHPGEVHVPKKQTSRSKTRDTNVILMEERRTYGDQKRSSGEQGNTASPAELEVNVWELRKQIILQIANRRNGKINLLEVAAECNVNIRIAAGWLLRLSKEGILSLVAGQRNTMTYLVKEVGGEKK